MADIRPQTGFQERVLACTADILISGGAAGAGKTWCSVVEPLRHIRKAGFRAAIFRRTSPELTGAGSVWEQSAAIYPALGATSRSSPIKEWVFGSGASVEMHHLQLEKDVYAHQSKAYALIIFEEVCHFTESQFWYLLSRNRSTCGVRPYVRATCNPDPDSFVAKMIDWWIGEDGYPIPERSGVLRWFVRKGDVLDWGDSREEVEASHPEMPPGSALSFTFIPGKLEDNQALTSTDPGYAARLASLPRVLRDRLLGGNWRVRAVCGSYFKRSYFEIVDEVPGPISDCVRFWDRAATEPSTENPDPDWTVGAKIAKLADGRYIVLHVEMLRAGPGPVERCMRNTATADGTEVTVGVFKDPGSAGKSELHHARTALDGFALRVIPATASKETMAGPFSAACEGGRVLLLRGTWNEAYLAALEAFPSKAHDDPVDASSGAFNTLPHADLTYA